MSIWIAIAVLCSSLLHASLEFSGRLDDYVGEVVGFLSPRWLKYPLLLLALANILFPLGLGLRFSGEWQRFLFLFVAGALLGDMFSTHLIPTWRRLAKRSSPATWTWILYLPLGTIILARLRPDNLLDALGIAAGVTSFVLLWPALYILKRIGVLPQSRPAAQSAAS
jgi:hypothetical protein